MGKISEKVTAILKEFFLHSDDVPFENAMSLFNASRYAEAIEEFEKIIKNHPSKTSLYGNLSSVHCSQAYRNLAFINFVMGNYGEACKKFQRTLELQPQQADLYHFMGICLNNMGDYDAAINAFRLVVESDVLQVSVKVKLSIVFQNLHMWDEAIKINTGIISENDRFADIHYRLGLAYLGKKKPEKARNAFAASLRINPTYLDAKVKLAITMAYLGDFEGAISILVEIKQTHPRFADIPYYLGIIYTDRCNFDRAKEMFEEAISLNQHYKDARIKMGLMHIKTNDMTSGIEALDKASRMHKEDANLAKAIDFLKSLQTTAISEKKDMKECLGQYFGEDSLLDQLITNFNQSIEITPDLSEMMSIILNFPESERSLFETILPYVKEYVNQQLRFPDMLCSLGKLHLKLNNYQEAEQIFREALEINPRYMKAAFDLFHLQKSQKRYKDALKTASLIEESSPPYADFYADLAEIYLDLKDTDKAQANAVRSLEIKPKYARAILTKALALEKRGNDEAAAQTLSEYLALMQSLNLSEAARELESRLNNKLTKSTIRS